ncbi:hypothetical protein SCB49_06387 [unidentified eubacterium SCB49]|nr:hypothetical protein SCB49_06387 [unidentified eubacterium SCB49]
MIHAYLINYAITGQMQLEENSNFNELLNAFILFYDDQTPDTATTLDDEIHNTMNDFIDTMALSLLAYATAQGYDDVDVSFCKKLCWGTMVGTDLFEEVLSSSQQLEYENIAAIEQDNILNENPKGTSCD